ncbi:MAG TPA: hypothetical protein PKK96_07720, partial [Anaerolineales bacterium]|nr:hypothetical protein [Anaerolineales bacterium]HNS60877.1 hypothetical protein [Anaerolineales bacterium]
LLSPCDGLCEPTYLATPLALMSRFIGNKPNKLFWKLTAKRAENADFSLDRRPLAFFSAPLFYF